MWMAGGAVSGPEGTVGRGACGSVCDGLAGRARGFVRFAEVKRRAGGGVGVFGAFAGNARARSRAGKSRASTRAGTRTSTLITTTYTILHSYGKQRWG